MVKERVLPDLKDFGFIRKISKNENISNIDLNLINVAFIRVINMVYIYIYT